jgi:cytoskeletal protein RodZ
MTAPNDVTLRDAGLRRLTRIKRWLLVGSVTLTGALSAVAANAFPGQSGKAQAPHTSTAESAGTTSSAGENASASATESATATEASSGQESTSVESASGTESSATVVSGGS